MFGTNKLNRLLNSIVEAVPHFLGAMASIAAHLLAINNALRMIMASQQELETKIDGLVEKASTSAQKDDAVLAALADVRRELKDMQEAGHGDEEALTRMAAKIDGAIATLDSSVAKEDAALSGEAPAVGGGEAPPAGEAAPAGDTGGDTGSNS